ncbi:hypothetical protein SIN09_00135 [Streptomyces sp. F8]|uniref:hypothetical protein n=1 Tax=Streptomyces sp. F8 TaxID=1436085 RepID=UPI0029D2F091|nr:hypothetical protein [Streptomyces sp. F8]MDX6757896.1 hypothetical protein [Streptomyces sp. F8]
MEKGGGRGIGGQLLAGVDLTAGEAREADQRQLDPLLQRVRELPDLLGEAGRT